MSINAVVLPLMAGALTLPEADARFILGLGSGDGTGSLGVELLVAPDQTIEDCKVWIGASEEGAQRICERARRMKVSVTARDGDGTPVHGFVYVARVARQGSERPRLPPYPLDMQVGVLEIPGRDTRKVVFANVLVDEIGSVLQCEADADDQPALGKIACEQAVALTLPVVHDRAGEAVRYVRSLVVEFVEEAAAD